MTSFSWLSLVKLPLHLRTGGFPTGMHATLFVNDFDVEQTSRDYNRTCRHGIRHSQDLRLRMLLAAW